MQAGDAIHTYRLRRGRTSASAVAAHHRAYPRYGVPPEGALDLAGLFGRSAPVVLEIGSGMGEAAAAMAAARPDLDLLAAEVHEAGVAALLQRIEQADLGNVRVAQSDAVPLLRNRLAAGSLSEVRIFFPDPWPKARHAKRRLVTRDFAALVAGRLGPGGLLHIATDWAPYAEQVCEALAGLFEVRLVPRPGSRPVTRYEQQGLRAGRPCYDLSARLRPPAAGRFPGQDST